MERRHGFPSLAQRGDDITVERVPPAIAGRADARIKEHHASPMDDLGRRCGVGGPALTRRPQRDRRLSRAGGRVLNGGSLNEGVELREDR